MINILKDLINKIINKIKLKKLVKLNNNTEKVKKISQYSKDDDLKEILLSIDDKNKRAEALENSIDKIDSKDVLKKVIKTLKDDDIEKLLNKKEEYLNNKDLNILYTTISSISEEEKRLSAINKYLKDLSDYEVALLLDKLNDKDSKEYIENEKVNIISKKIIYNYIKHGTILHVEELFKPIKKESKLYEVVNNCIEKNRIIEKKIKSGEITDNYRIFDEEGKEYIIKKLFKGIKITSESDRAVERNKQKILMNLYKNKELSYESVVRISEKSIYSKNIRRQTLSMFLKQNKLNERNKKIEDIKQEEKNDERS